MAQASTLPFSALKIMLESTTTPGTFVAPCGLTSRGLTFSKETNDTTTPDCEDEDAASWVERDVVSKSVSISVEGVAARESLPRWRAAFEDDNPTLARVEVSGTAAQGGGYWSGLFHLTETNPAVERGQRATLSCEMQSTGSVLWTPAAA